jgi:hypothetical protein
MGPIPSKRSGEDSLRLVEAVVVVEAAVVVVVLSAVA